MKRVAAGFLVGLVGLFVVATPPAQATITIGDLTFNGAEVILNGAIFKTKIAPHPQRLRLTPTLVPKRQIPKMRHIARTQHGDAQNQCMFHRRVSGTIYAQVDAKFGRPSVHGIANKWCLTPYSC